MIVSVRLLFTIALIIAEVAASVTLILTFYVPCGIALFLLAGFFFVLISLISSVIILLKFTKIRNCLDCCLVCCAGGTNEYNQPRFVTIGVSPWKILIIIAQVGFFIGFVIVYQLCLQNLYNQTDYAISSILTKVKGVASTLDRDLPEQYKRIWDPADYVIPPQQNAAFFVLTNAIITLNQTQSICQEDPQWGTCAPSNKSDCPKGERAGLNGNGFYTGNCKKSDINETLNTCEIKAWCPVQPNSRIKELKEEALLPQVYNSTVLIKNTVQFQIFNFTRRNILDEINNQTYLLNCTYNEETDPLCPIFSLGFMVEQANEKFSTIAITGGVIAVKIKWHCNLDYPNRPDWHDCKPRYSFRRADNPNVQIAQGYNFMVTNYHNNQKTRDLIKAYGILFVIEVEGVAVKFSLTALVLIIGSSLGLLGTFSTIGEYVLSLCMARRGYYSGQQYLQIEKQKTEDHRNEETIPLIATERV